MKNIIIIGARGYKASYGGWETFVTNLIENYNDKNVKFHIPELTTEKQEKNKIIEKDNVSCLQVYSPSVGFVTMFIYAIKALQKINKYIKEQKLENCIVYVLGCRMGPFYKSLVRPLKKRGIKKLKVVYSKEQPIKVKKDKASQITSENVGRIKDVPGSVSFVPSVAGLIIAGQVIKKIRGDENEGN